MLRDLALQAMVMAMMASVGLHLTFADAWTGMRRWWVLALAVLANVVLMPALVLAVGELLQLSTGTRMGLLVCAAAPGGPTGPMFTRIARGDLGFGTSLQVLLSVLALLGAPLTLELLGHREGPSLLWPMAQTLAVFQLLPLASGMLVRRWRPSWADRVGPVLGKLANALLVLVVIGLLVTRGESLLSQGIGVHAALVALVALPIVSGLPLRPGPLRSALLAAGLVTAVRNVSVALLLSASFFAHDPAVDVAILVWGFYMMVIPGVLAWRLGRVPS